MELPRRPPRGGHRRRQLENGDGSDWSIAFRFPRCSSEVEQGVGLGAVDARALALAGADAHGPRPTRLSDWLAGASMMVRRRCSSRIGGLDETFFLYFEETEFCHRAKRAGFEVWYVPASRVAHIAGQSTKVTERDAGPRRLPSTGSIAAPVLHG